MSAITSRDNPRVRRWRELVRNARARREQRRVMIEGEHLVLGFLQSGGIVEELILSKSGARRTEFTSLAIRTGKSPIVLADAVFRAIADTQTPSGIAAEIALPGPAFDPKGSPGCVILEAVQDAGNVGAILRSAGAFGIKDAILGEGCADAWSPKVLRAAMGAHFAMRIAERADLAAGIGRFGGTVACTVPRGGIPIADAKFPRHVAWIFGAEGQGVSEALAARTSLKISIPMRGGSESLNVAAAAAICFYEYARRTES